MITTHASWQGLSLSDYSPVEGVTAPRKESGIVYGAAN